MSILERIGASFPELKEKDAAQLSPLVLAYMGDCIYDMYVRTLLIQKSDFTPHKLHLEAAKRVNAGAQARAAEKLLPYCTEKEAAVYKRGRNAHMGTIAKNASIADYRAATGLEAVLGYLYLQKEDDRIAVLMELALAEENPKKDEPTKEE